jgi:hypothetical protein
MHPSSSRSALFVGSTSRVPHTVLFRPSSASAFDASLSSGCLPSSSAEHTPHMPSTEEIARLSTSLLKGDHFFGFQPTRSLCPSHSALITTSMSQYLPINAFHSFREYTVVLIKQQPCSSSTTTILGCPTLNSTNNTFLPVNTQQCSSSRAHQMLPQFLAARLFNPTNTLRSPADYPKQSSGHRLVNTTHIPGARLINLQYTLAAQLFQNKHTTCPAN